MKITLLSLGLAGLLGLTACAHMEAQKKKEDAVFAPTPNSDSEPSIQDQLKSAAQEDSRYLLVTDEAPERSPR